MIELARAKKVDLPSFTEDGLRELVFKSGYQNLDEYLHGFQYTCAVLNDPESLERVAYELAWDNINEGVRYFEVRFAPMLHVTDKIGLEQVLTAVDGGLNRAKKEYNGQLHREGDSSPPFEYGIITCAMRMFSAGFSTYYRKLCEAHTYMPRRQLYGLASLELAQGVVAIRDKTGLPLVGFDLAGSEDGYPAEDHVCRLRLCSRTFHEENRACR